MATVGQQELKTKYPVVQGLEADQKHDGEKNELEAQEQSFIDEKLRRLL